MSGLTADVGPNRPNHQNDVQAVQQHLRQHAAWLAPVTAPQVTGRFDDATAKAIVRFQETAAALLHPDGIVSQNGFTIRRLEMPSIPKPQSRVFQPGPFSHPSGGLTDSDFATAASTLGVQSAAAQAVAQTETARDPWDNLGRPSILFERHKFYRWTNGAYSSTHPDICNSSPGGYGKFAEQYGKLYRAAVLDESAALKSASWGAFQILGENHVAAGYSTVADFVAAMLVSEQNHLKGFVAFVIANPAMHQALQQRDWDGFARRYNGPNYQENDYANKMRTAYEALGGTC